MSNETLNVTAPNRQDKIQKLQSDVFSIQTKLKTIYMVFILFQLNCILSTIQQLIDGVYLFLMFQLQSDTVSTGTRACVVSCHSDGKVYLYTDEFGLVIDRRGNACSPVAANIISDEVVIVLKVFI